MAEIKLDKEGLDKVFSKAHLKNSDFVDIKGNVIKWNKHTGEKDWEVEYIVPLEFGGKDFTDNMQPISKEYPQEGALGSRFITSPIKSRCTFRHATIFYQDYLISLCDIHSDGFKKLCKRFSHLRNAAKAAKII